MGAAARLLVLQRHTQPASAATASAAAAALLADGAGTVQIDPPLPNEPLGEKEVAEFLDRGLLVLPSILTTEHVAELKQTVDEVMADRAGGAHARYIVEYEMLAGLCAHPPVVERVKQLMGRYGNGREDCCMHHMHVSRHDPGAVGARWHHDYNAVPSVHDRAQLSIHVFYYFAGLDGEIGDLLALPRSQYAVHPVRGIGELFGTADLPGSVVINSLPEGSAVVLHSGLMHARRPKPGGSSTDPRYFVDVEYVQPGAQRWPAYLSSEQHGVICDIGRRNGFGRPQHEGRTFSYEHLWDFSEEVYCDSTEFYRFFSSLPSVERD